MPFSVIEGGGNLALFNYGGDRRTRSYKHWLEFWKRDLNQQVCWTFKIPRKRFRFRIDV